MTEWVVGSRGSVDGVGPGVLGVSVDVSIGMAQRRRARKKRFEAGSTGIEEVVTECRAGRWIQAFQRGKVSAVSIW